MTPTVMIACTTARPNAEVKAIPTQRVGALAGRGSGAGAASSASLSGAAAVGGGAAGGGDGGAGGGGGALGGGWLGGGWLGGGWLGGGWLGGGGGGAGGGHPAGAPPSLGGPPGVPASRDGRSGSLGSSLGPLDGGVVMAPALPLGAPVSPIRCHTSSSSWGAWSPCPPPSTPSRSARWPGGWPPRPGRWASACPGF